jgi:uncharacterized protein with NRDE domain
MCLVAIAIDQSRQFPLVVAANRDEFFDRPTQRMAWWSPGAGLPDILGGRDLKAGGTWLGLTAAGRLALVTNVRDGHAEADPAAPSRGSIVPLWLRGDLPMEHFWARIALSGYNGFNVIAADFQQGVCFWGGNDGAYPVRLQRGVYGLSNASLDTPWPKVTTLKQRMAEGIAQAGDTAKLATRLFEALADNHPADDEHLPRTGIPMSWERTLSPAFIRAPEQRYGTRSSTLIVAERVGRRLLTHVVERSFGTGTAVALLRQTTLRDWPPRYTLGTPTRAVAQADVTDGEEIALSGAPAQRRRSLLPPAHGRAPRASRAGAASAKA